MRTVYSTKASFILKHNHYVFTRHTRLCYFAFYNIREVFLKASCSSLLVLGRLLYGTILRNPCRSNIRYIVDSATSLPTFSSYANFILLATTNFPDLLCSSKPDNNSLSSSIVMFSRWRPPRL